MTTCSQNEPMEIVEASEEGPEKMGVVSSVSDEPCENDLSEYETQLLGFTPVTLINGMFNSVCDLYRDALKAFCATCQEKFPGVMAGEELNKARHAVSQEIDKDISEVFDKLEMFVLRNVFTIPNECVLPEDMCQLTFQSSENDRVKTDIKELKKKIIAVKYANACLVNQLEKAEAFKEMLSKVLESLAAYKQVGNEDVNIKDVLSHFSDMVMEAFGKHKN